MRSSWLAVVAVVGLLLPVLADDAAKGTKIELKSFSFKVPKEQAELFGFNEGEDKLFFYAGGTAEVKSKVADEGEYEIVIKASSDKALNEGGKFKLTVNGNAVGKETETADGDPKEYKFTTTLKAGEVTLAIEFTNDAYKENEYDRNLYVQAVTIKKVK
jgi:hypothetical protein